MSKLIESMERTPAARGPVAGLAALAASPCSPGAVPPLPREAFFRRGVVSWAREQAPETAAAAEAAAARPRGVLEVDKGTAWGPGVRPRPVYITRTHGVTSTTVSQHARCNQTSASKLLSHTIVGCAADSMSWAE